MAATRGLDIFVFNVQQVEGVTLTSHKQSLDFLKELGFNTIPGYSVVDNIDDALDIIDKIGESRGSLEYDIDGAVVKVDDFAMREQLGSTAKFPNGQLLLNIHPRRNRQKLSILRLQSAEREFLLLPQYLSLFILPVQLFQGQHFITRTL